MVPYLKCLKIFNNHYGTRKGTFFNLKIMQVSLSRKSWHARYYNWVKGYYPTYEFKSLCPYFWTIISFILLLPVFLVWKGIKLALKTTVNPIQKGIVYVVGKSVSEPYKKKEPGKVRQWFSRNDKKIGVWYARLYFGFMGLVLLTVLVGSTIKLFQEKGAWLGFIYIFAFIGAFTTSVFIIWGIISFFETDTWRMIKGMSYSAKNKVCPMIKWDNNESTELS